MQKENKTILIRASPEGFYLNDNLLIPGTHTNLPWGHFSFHPSRPVYWEVSMTRFDANQQALYVEVVDYEPEDITPFSKQQPTREIKYLRFKNLDWMLLQSQLSTYQKSKFSGILQESNIKSVLASQRENLHEISFRSDHHKVPDEAENFEKISFKESFWITFNDARIELGYISFQKFIPRLDRVLYLKVYNDHLLPEFNTIRYWFAKKLGTKRFYVNATISLEGSEVVKAECTSAQIDQIGPGLIDSIKYQRVHSLTKEIKIVPPDKGLFTADEMFGLLDSEDEQGNVFQQSEADILAMLLEKTNIRNKKQLAYLAGSKHSPEVKLRFTLNPHFGFLFYVSGEQSHHFIWELLNSHATYIWSADKSSNTIEQILHRLEYTINTIRSSGRDAYKNAYRNNHTDTDVVFHFIPHEDIDSKLVDGFPKWKMRLNEQLI